MKAKTHPFYVLTGHNFMALTTFRKTGQPVATPVWFAQEGDYLYVTTQASAGKVKRIRNNAQVEVAPCDARGTLLGESTEGMARILAHDQANPAKRALAAKYGWQWRAFNWMMRMRGKDMLFIEITPMW